MDALETLARLGDGYFVEDLGGELLEVAESVLKKAQRTGRPDIKGKVTVTFHVLKAPGSDPTVIVVPVIEKKLPSREPSGLLFFAYEGEFHSRDPRQPSLNVRVVETSTGEVREAPAGEPAPAREVE